MKRLYLLCAMIILPNTLLADDLLTYDNLPMGTEASPLLLRTFMPKIYLADDVLTNHQLGKKSPKYNPSKGKDVAGEYVPITGLPAAMGVNYGKKLSFCWDTVECRLLYAWNDGFLDMKNYWGDPIRGNRQSFGYVPELVGNLFYIARGKHPIAVNGVQVSSPLYTGYSKTKNVYQFDFKTQKGEQILTTITPLDEANGFKQHIKLIGKGKLSYIPLDPSVISIKKISDQEMIVTIKQGTLKIYTERKEEKLSKDQVSVANGEKIFQAMACATCHSIDGSKSHGPSLKGLAGSMRKITDLKQAVLADDEYIRDSIHSPNKKVVEGFPPNYMPPFKLPKYELDSVLLYIKSLKNK